MPLPATQGHRLANTERLRFMILTRRFGALGARPNFPSVTDIEFNEDDLQWRSSPFDVVRRRRERGNGGAPDQRDPGGDAAAS
jgi:hypothetical protein